MELLERRELLAVLLVTSTADTVDPDDGVLTLREAILESNAAPDADGRNEIQFAIPESDPGYDPATGAFSIRPTSPLPQITAPLIIDGWTQSGWSGSPLIELDGSEAGADAMGLVISASDSTVRGLVINRFDHTGIFVIGARGVIEGNHIGTDVTGTISAGNAYGIVTNYNAAMTRIGTDGDGVSDSEERNVISGNSIRGVSIMSSDVTIAGNFIGTDITGSFAVPNFFEGVVAHGNADRLRIGTNGDGIADVDERNVISGNGRNGIYLLRGDDIIVAGNLIGTDVTGTYAIGNRSGVLTHFAERARIGTNADGLADEAERNIISGNTGSGVQLGLGAPGGSHVVAGNYIGTDITGTVALGNYVGLRVSGNTHNRVGTNGDGVHDVAERNIISGNLAQQVMISDRTTDNVVAGNYIGTDVTGTVALGGGTGVFFGGDVYRNRIGTSGQAVDNEAERNVIAGVSGHGVHFHFGGSDNELNGNWIGVNAHGDPLGNSLDGIFINGGQGNQIGGEGLLGNVIAHNGGNGVALGTAADTVNNTIRGNSIHSNGMLGIDLGADGVTPNDPGDLDTGPNNLQNFPVIHSVNGGDTTRVTGTLNSLAESSFIIDFYANAELDPSGHGEGQRWLGSSMVTTDEDGNTAFDVYLATETSTDEYVTATATRLQAGDDELGESLVPTDTSEFSAGVLIERVLQPIEIDVRDVVNVQNQGVIAVTVFGSVDFDVTRVAIDSVVFAGAFVSHYAYADVNGNGDLDLVLHFRTQETNLRTVYEQLLADDINDDGSLSSNRQEATVTLTGRTVDEVFFEGADQLDLFLSGKALRNMLEDLAERELI